MSSSWSSRRRFGFTLVEVLVTTVVVAVLAAVVLPALAKQTSAADPARIASDLKNIKMGIEVFSNNLRPDFPGDLEDLVNHPIVPPSTTVSSTTDDLAADNLHYVNRELWNGPYLAQTLPVVTAGTGSTTFRAGAAGFYENDVKICPSLDTGACSAEGDTNSPFVTVQINGLSLTEAANVDVLFDGSPGTSTTGLFRYAVSGSTAFYTGFYYAVPYAP